MVEAVVEFDYTAREVDELTIRKGDVISDVRIQPGGWWEGCLHGRRGMFPDNFVKVRDKSDVNSVLEVMANNEVQLRTSSGRKCRVLYSYQPNNEDELELQLNDVIDILDEVEEGWWRGKLRNRVGVFPSNFVTEITEKQANGGPGSRKTSATQPPPLSLLRKEENISSGETDSPASPTGPDSGNPNALDIDADAPTLPPKPVKELCRVLYPYEAANEDELTVKEGDIITIITKEVQDKGWWKGELRGRIGVFPDNFVSVMLLEEHPQVRKPDRPPGKVVQTVPGTRTNDIVTKPTSASNIPSSKKPVESTIKADDKAPPTLSKKPALPPTSKKPQLRASSQQTVVTTALKKVSNETSNSPEQRLNDLVDGTASSKVTSLAASSDLDFDGVERAAMLTHPTASRAKAPRRRLPTYMLNKDSETSPGMMNGNGEHHESLSADSSFNSQISEPEKENGLSTSTPGSISSASSGTASNRNSKEWEKNKAPWMEELKMSQAAKKGQAPKSSPASNATKQEQARSKSDIPDSPASPTTPEPIKTTAITFRQHSTGSVSTNAAPTPPTTCPVPAGARPQSVHGDVPSVRFSSPPSAARPLSMYSPASNDKSSPITSPTTVSTSTPATFTMKQFQELVDKVSKLEQHCECLTRTVTELNVQVKEEREKRIQLQQELEKLADLVTQV